MSLRHIFERYIVPGLVIQAVIVGGGYATGRELVEFFVSQGPATGITGMFVTALLCTACAMVSFELARIFGAYDYRSFCRTYLGRLAIVFEVGYIALLLLVLSVVSAATAALVGESLGWPPLASSIAYMVVVALIVFFGSTIIERIISIWSMIFYATYLTLCGFVVARFGPQLSQAIDFSTVKVGAAIGSGLTYVGYNIVVLPILIFVARNFRTRREALTAGFIAGPLILMPGIALLFALSAFYPQIVQSPLPVTYVLGELGIPALSLIVKLVILGALVKTGAGLLHGLNERIARAAADRGSVLPGFMRPAISIGLMIIAVFAASRFGLIKLIGNGYRYSSYFFLLVYVLPVLTVGIWLIVRSRRPTEPSVPTV